MYAESWVLELDLYMSVSRSMVGFLGWVGDHYWASGRVYFCLFVVDYNNKA
jgi:hypothetical protein